MFIIGTRTFKSKEQFLEQANKQFWTYMSNAYTDMCQFQNYNHDENINDDTYIDTQLDSIERWIRYSREVFDIISGRALGLP
jgi:hypothetical protein